MIKISSLTPKEKEIVIHKGTEACYTTSFDRMLADGTYLCRNCGIGLFSNKNQFNSGTGWPSFDQELSNNIKTSKDLDNIRTEVLCKKCNAHLGHVFFGEGFTELNTRYCINSVALEFVPFVTTQVPLIDGGISLLCSPHTLRTGFTNLTWLAPKSNTKLPSTFPDFLPIWSSLTVFSFT